MRIALALLLISLLPRQSETAQEATGSIRGAVYNLYSGVPIDGAAVTLISGGENLTRNTGRDGKFEFTGLLPRRGTVHATAAGFNYPNATPMSNRSRMFSLETGQQIEIRIGLVPAFTISGRVLDENKQPISKVPVQVAQKGYLADGSEAVVGAGRSALTDELGEFRISNVIPGDYRLNAVRDDVTTYYPGVRFSDQAVPVSVSVVDVAGLNFQLVQTKRYSIRFRLSGVTPAPKSISVQLPSRSPSTQVIPPYKNLPTTPDGIYTFEEILPGAYRLMIHWDEEQPPGATVNPLTRAARTVAFDIVDRDVDLGTIEVERRVSIDGSITFKEMLPFRVNMILSPYPGQPPTLRSSEWWIGENNTFSISEIPEGRYTLQTSELPPGHYLASAVLDGVDVLGREIMIDGVKDGRLDVVFASPAGSVMGVVRDAKGDPFSEATVVLLPPADRREGMPSSFVVSTDKNGTFSLARVAPGDYSVFAWQDVPINAYRNAEWLRSYEAFGTRVTVKAGTPTNVNLRLIGQTK